MIPTQTRLDFPCRFTLKVMGVASENFLEEILAIVRQHAPHTAKADIKITPSKGGNYTGLTLTVDATHHTQLDALYHDLVAHKNVKMVL